MTETASLPAPTAADDATAPVAVGRCPHCGFVVAAHSQHAQIACPECKGRIKLAWVVGRTSEGVPCDGTCQYAWGKSCSCSCGGVNHGRGYIRVDYVPTWVRDRDRAAHAKRASAAADRVAAKRQAAADRIAERQEAD